jgi:hypothetical protein
LRLNVYRLVRSIGRYDDRGTTGKVGRDPDLGETGLL